MLGKERFSVMLVERAKRSLQLGRRVKFALIGVWAVFTLALAGWWSIFSLSQVERLYLAGIDPQSDLIRYQKMLFWEGAVLVLLVVGGAIAMLWAVWRQIKESERLLDFLSVFAHELKTPLASVMLQAEIFREESFAGLSKEEIEAKSARFIGDLTRLNLHLENAVELARQSSSSLFREQLDLGELVSELRSGFPELKIVFLAADSPVLLADRRALIIILGNLINNAVRHGQATEVRIVLQRDQSGGALIEVQDNGKGFVNLAGRIDPLKLTRLYVGSGSGIGLKIVSKLVSAMQGEFAIDSTKAGVLVRIAIPQD